MEQMVVSSDGHFIGNLSLSNLATRNYAVISVIGCQSSGKSTLLNNLFQTNFPVLDTKKNGRQRTTLGTTKSVCEFATEEGGRDNKKLMLLDVEGVDSRERKEPTKKFDYCTTLFCLCISDLMIVNMWFRDVGRFQAANYELFTTVFSSTLRLRALDGLQFTKKQTKLLIVLRDFEDSETSTEQVEWIMLQDFCSIWQNTEKPQDLEYLQLEDVFSISFHFLPHPFYRKEEFMEAVTALRSRTCGLEDRKNLLLSENVWKQEIPLDMMPSIMKETWNFIKEYEGLFHISEQVSYFDLNTYKKCSIYLEQAWFEYRPQILQLKMNVENRYTSPLEDFSTQAHLIFDSCLEYFEELASSYKHSSSFELKRKFLIAKLSNELLQVRNYQVWAYRDHILHAFEMDFAPMIGGMRNFQKEADKVVKKHMKTFRKCMEKCRVPGLSKEEEVWDIEDFQRTLQNMVDDRNRQGTLFFPIGFSQGNTRKKPPWWKELLIKLAILYIQYLQSKSNSRSQRKRMQSQERLLPKGPTF
eukprot:jgi/Galph1/4300/GphlegSOOS_G2965.1